MRPSVLTHIQCADPLAKQTCQGSPGLEEAAAGFLTNFLASRQEADMAKLHAKKAKQHAKDRKEAESKKFITL